jgi:hypothetical protein
LRTVEFRRLFDDQNAARVRFETERNRVLGFMVEAMKSSSSGVVRHPKRVVERNIALLGDVMRYLLAEPQLLASLPENFELVILPDDDPVLRRYNLELVDAYESAGKPIVFVRTKAARTPDPVRARPSLYVPLTA